MSKETNFVRKRKHPNRFGNAATISDSESSNDFSSDDSMDNYSPEENPKIVATIKRTRMDKDDRMQVDNFDENFAQIDGNSNPIV